MPHLIVDELESYHDHLLSLCLKIANGLKLQCVWPVSKRTTVQSITLNDKFIFSFGYLVLFFKGEWLYLRIKSISACFLDYQ